MLQNNKRISIKDESFGVLSGIEIFISNKWYIVKNYFNLTLIISGCITI